MENFNDEKVCLCALNRIFGFEPKIGRMLVEAFGGYELIMEAYDTAVKNNFMFGCYGDAMLILDD